MATADPTQGSPSPGGGETTTSTSSTIPPMLASNVALIHHILLADPSEYPNMTLSGQPRQLHTPSYDEFSASLLQRSSNNSGEGGVVGGDVDSIASTMKKAFRDELCDRIRNTGNDSSNNNNSDTNTELSMQPAQPLLLELHQQLRALIPSRTELHGILKDDAVRQAQSSKAFGQLLVEAAQALVRLESEARAESTLAWISKAAAAAVAADGRNPCHDDGPEMQEQEDVIFFLVTSLLYLLFKAELCSSDKQDFYFVHMWLPQLLRKGPSLEREAFVAHYGPFDHTSTTTAPATRKWLQPLQQSISSSASSLQHQQQQTKSERATRIRKSWVDDILFRNRHMESIALPEIFYLDQRHFQSIRTTVRMAVAGSALALHACRTAGQSTDVLAQPLDPSSSLDLRRAVLVQAMGDNRGKPQDEYRRDITEAVLALTRHWNPALLVSLEESLRHRTEHVLDAQDPVVELLEQRMKACFSDLLTHVETTTTMTTPSQLKSGRGTGTTATTTTALSRKASFLQKANAQFSSKGLAFFSSDLAVAAWQALRVVEVALDLYDTVLLEPIYSAASQ